MKHFFKVLLVIALANVALGTVSYGGEVKKQPLKMEEKQELSEEEAKDHPDVRHVAAGLTSGYGIIQLAAAVGIGYLVYDQIEGD
jgi:hypothetical protein